MNKSSAFTLIELLVVIAVIAILMAILMPALNLARDQGRKMAIAIMIPPISPFMMVMSKAGTRQSCGFLSMLPLNLTSRAFGLLIERLGKKMVAACNNIFSKNICRLFRWH
ncbi:MAG: prepilin-type N-terminal cleavage/methylation domain-containing protein [Sedimentisphaerales bacterium]|nr:prepilin-type N-terminal cleavage/methylation domain-containing protein [Sedimentisphaerales bacterium]